MRRFVHLAKAALLAALLSTAAVPHADAAEYPARPIKVIVPFSPGGSTDIVARALEKVAKEYFGQPFVIENKPGAGGILGWNEIVQARPDGYTIGIPNSGMIPQTLYGNARFDYATEMEAIAQVGEIPFVWVVKSDAPWANIEEFMAYAKANPHKIKYGITGVGNTAHLGPEALKLESKIEIDHVSFDGGGPLIAALLGGHIQAASNNPVDLKEHIKAGRVRVLAVFGDSRIDDPLLKDVPTFKEKGYNAVSTLWQGVGAPKGLPADVKKKLGDAFGAMLNTPEMRETIRNLGLVPVYLGPDDFAKKWLEDRERLRKVVTETGLLEVIKSQKK
jgi:tripartite-type tricarboxylate transporter receptor subunit TctC